MYVIFTADNGPQVRALLGETSPILTDGFGGWEVVDRPKRVGVTRFTGKQPFKQELSILLDGWENGESIEPDIAILSSMTEQPNDLLEPPKIKLYGMALRKDLTWIIEDIEWTTDKTIWDEATTGQFVRVRQGANVSMLEYVTEDLVTTPAQPAVTKAVTLKPKAPAGMTVKEFAAWVYKEPGRWQEILEANQFMKQDPRYVIPAGTVVVVPNYIGGFYTARVVVPS